MLNATGELFYPKNRTHPEWGWAHVVEELRKARAKVEAAHEAWASALGGPTFQSGTPLWARPSPLSGVVPHPKQMPMFHERLPP
eukprot:8047398-Pyramimonas_sp.AAC.1